MYHLSQWENFEKKSRLGRVGAYAKHLHDADSTLRAYVEENLARSKRHGLNFCELLGKVEGKKDPQKFSPLDPAKIPVRPLNGEILRIEFRSDGDTFVIT